MRYVGWKKKRRRGLIYRLSLLIEEINYLGKKVVVRHLRHLFAKFIFLSFFFIAVIFVSGILGCGGPPQNTDVGEEGPASLSVSSGDNIGEVITTITSQHTITINNASASVSATQVSLISTPSAPLSFAGGGFPGTGGTCSDTLPPLTDCTVVLESNAITTGNINTSFSLSYWDGLAIQTFTANITGTARAPIPAILAFSPTGDHDYGINAIGGTFDTTLTITNSGELTATAITPNGLTPPFSVAGGSCGATLAMSQSCTLVIRYTPTTQVVSNDTLNLNYNDGAAPQVINKNLQGEGRIAANLIVDQGTTFNIGMLNSGFVVDQPLTVRNTGSGTAIGIAFNSFTAPFTIISNSCGASLVPAATCNLTVRFAPTATTNYAITPTIDYSDGFNAQAVNMNFSGDGFANALALSLISPASSPSNNSTPTIRVSNTINGINIRLYRNASCVTQEGATTGATGASLDFSPTMPEGTYQFHARAEDDYGNLSACSTSLVNYEYDNTAPNAPSNVTLASTLTTSSSNSPNISWTASPSGDVVAYEIGLSSLPAGGNDIAGWSNVGAVTSASFSSLTLTECNSFYASVRAIDDVSLPSNHATSPTNFIYDSALPTTPSSLAVGSDATPTNSATISWSASSDNCGIDHYEYAIGTTAGASNTLAWTDIGNVTTYRQNGMTLASSTNYFTSVRAVDSSGRTSLVATSSAWIIFDPPAALPNMIAWLDGADRSTLLDSSGRDATNPLFNGTVEDWQDKSGSANTHHFNSHLAAPAYSQANFSLTFDATTGMTTPNHNEINLQTVVQRNITVAFRTSADVNTRQILYEEGGNVRGMNIFIFNGSLHCGFYNFVAADGDGIQNYTSVTSALAANTTYFVTWVFDYTNYTGPAGADGSLNCYVNDTLVGSTTTTSRLFGHSGAVGLGVINNQTVVDNSNTVVGSGANFLGEIYEVMLFNDAPDASDVSNVHTYLDNKWN